MNLLIRSNYVLPQRLKVRLAAFLGGIAFAFVVFAACPLAALAASWSAETVAPTYFVPGKASAFAVVATDTSPAGGLTIKDDLPAGVEVTSIIFDWSAVGIGTNLNAGESFCPKPIGREVVCEIPPLYFLFFGSVKPGQAVRVVVNLKVLPTAPEGTVTNNAVVEGDSLTSASTSTNIDVNPHPMLSFTKLSIEPTETTEITKETGEDYYNIVNEPYKQPFTQAGGHPWALTSKFEFATEATGANEYGEINMVPVRDPKEVVASLPPGLLGDPMAVPRCSLTLVTNGGQCPGDTQIGVYHIHHNGVKELLGPIVNVTPEAGQSAEFALENEDQAIITPLVTAHLVRTEEVKGGRVLKGYGLTLVTIVFQRSDCGAWN